MNLRLRCFHDGSDSELMNLLEKYHVRYEFRGEMICYSMERDWPCVPKILNEKPPLRMTKEALFTEAELDQAEWLSVSVRFGRLRTAAPQYTFSADCPGDGVSGHRIRQNPYVYTKGVPWKPNGNFACGSDGDFSSLFCSAAAKNTLEKHGIRGIRYRPVLHEPAGRARRDIFHMELPHPGVDSWLGLPCGGALRLCPGCGRTEYIPEEPGWFPVSIMKGFLCQENDAYQSNIWIHGESGDYQLILFSQKLYRVLHDELKDKNLRFEPVLRQKCRSAAEPG